MRSTVPLTTWGNWLPMKANGSLCPRQPVCAVRPRFLGNVGLVITRPCYLRAGAALYRGLGRLDTQSVVWYHSVAVAKNRVDVDGRNLAEIRY
jgi:hypothetical protein